MLYLGKQYLESHVQQALFKLLQDHERGLEDCFPAVLEQTKLEACDTYNDKIVPNPEQLPHVVACRLVLHHLGKQGDKVG